MKGWQRRAGAALLAGVLALLGGGTARSEPQTDRNEPQAPRGSITVTLRHSSDEGPVAGGAFALYAVAEAQPGEPGGIWYTYLPAFADCGMGLGDLNQPNLAVHLAHFAAQNGIEPMAEQAAVSGQARFTGLEPQLYLVVQTQAAPGYYPLAPFLVSLPLTEGAGLVYDVTAAPKVEAKNPGYDVPPQEPPTEPEGRRILVKKRWQTEGAHPDAVWVQLFRDGELYQAAALSEKNGWQYVWEGLDKSHAWTVSEAEVPPGYQVDYSFAGSTITLTNARVPTPPEPPAPEKPLPEPSSGEPPELWQTGWPRWLAGLLALAGLGLFTAGWGRPRRRPRD